MSENTVQTESMADVEDLFDIANPWNRVKDYMEKKTPLTLKVEGVVNGGVIVNVEELRGFVPASRLSLSYTENLEDYLLQEITVRVIDVDQANNKLVLSAREILQDAERKARKSMIENVKVGTIAKGTVESLQNYGAFVRLENGLSGLVHISQISHTRIKTPGDVLKAGEEIEVKIIGVNDGKISLSIKALQDSPEEEVYEAVEIPVAEAIGTTLGDLFKGLKL
ncbi:MAG: S1 RNA-binding domain-containing protein [Eubacteriales bacterium]